MARSRVRTGPFVALVALAVAGLGCSGGHHSGGSFQSQASTAPASTVKGSTTPASSSGTSSTPAPTTSSTTTSPSSGSTQGPVPTYGTRHCWPIVLVHGTPGWNQLGPVEYWYGIPELLRANGFEVFVVQDKAFGSVEERAQELHDQIVAKYPDPRVKINLVGHSMGGIDCRYAVSTLGMANRVASVTTIGSPHRGTSVADVIVGLVPGPVVSIVNSIIGLLGWDLKGIEELTTVYMTQTFNPANPDAPGVSYFSWTGVADPLGQTNGCIVDPLFIPTWSLVSNLEGPNDGLVSEKSAQWGTFQGVLPADHMNEVDQPLGITTAGFDAKGFYETWAEQLEARGFGP